MTKILAITACTAGVAHTYMAAKTLEKKAKERGLEIKVEKQGANGIDDRITKQDVE
ncbi:MAG: PTS system fructose-like transporter subunit IIB, partial [Psychromonas sp.]